MHKNTITDEYLVMSIIDEKIFNRIRSLASICDEIKYRQTMNVEYPVYALTKISDVDETLCVVTMPSIAKIKGIVAVEFGCSRVLKQAVHEIVANIIKTSFMKSAACVGPRSITGIALMSDMPAGQLVVWTKLLILHSSTHTR